MVDQPLVSVLMTVYNREKYLAEAIQSVMGSTYQNWELILVDDRSKDRSVEIAKSFQDKDERIKVYVNETNLGDYANRNQAAAYAKGKYLKYVDADDMIYAYGLEQLVFYMEQFPEAGYGLCSIHQDKFKHFPFQLTPEEAYKYHYLQNNKIFYKAPLSSIIKKTVFESVGGFSGKQHVGDFEMWHKLSMKYNVVLMPIGMVWYREHDEQQMNENRTDPFIPFKYVLLTKSIISDADCPLDQSDKDKVLNQVEMEEARSIMSAIKHHSLKKGKQLMKESDMSVKDIVANMIKLKLK